MPHPAGWPASRRARFAASPPAPLPLPLTPCGCPAIPAASHLHPSPASTPPGNAPLVQVVEDEAGIADILVAYLQRDGLRTLVSDDGQLALQAFERARPDLVLLDIRLPAMDGVDVLRNIRAHSDTPVIMLTAFVDDVDKLLSLRLGADDYITKPFNPAEVVARVRAVLRRSGLAGASASATAASTAASAGGRPVPPLRAGPIEIDLQAHQASVLDAHGIPRPLSLTLTEFRLLACLAAQPRRCFSRSHLIETCLPESDALDRVIDSHLSKLRRKLLDVGQQGLIETVRGIGYRLWPGP